LTSFTSWIEYRSEATGGLDSFEIPKTLG